MRHPGIIASAQLSAGSGGGGDVPEWVPDNAEIFVDLIAANNQAWEDGVGEGSPASYFGVDANTENAWGTTSYNEAELTSDGLAATGPVALIGTARSTILGDSTFVMKFVQTSAEDDPREIDIVIASTDGNDAIEIAIGVNSADGNVEAYSWGGSFDETVTAVVNGFEEGAVNALAMTLDGFRCEFSLNGCDPVAVTLDETDRPSSNPLTTVIVDLGGGNALQSVATYSTLPSTAGLAALAATGIANTAPESITVDWLGFGDGGVFTIETTASEGVHTNPSYNIAVYVDEPQGNPSTLTILDDAEGRISFGQATNRNKAVEFDNSGGLDHVGEPTITFTLRATDRGGLSVDQADQPERLMHSLVITTD
jgi:hypothetical protein